MSQIIVLDPPLVFYSLLRAIRPVLDPVTAEKIHIVKGAHAFDAYARAWQESSAGAVGGGEAVEVVEVVLGEESLELGEQIVEEADDTTPVVPVMAAAAVVELEQRREPMAK